VHREVALATVLSLVGGCADEGAGHRVRGNVLLRSGKVQEALAEYRALIATDPSSPSGHWLLGNALHEAGRDDEAIRAYQAALEQSESFVEARCELGILLFHAGKRDEALAQFRQVLKLRPDDVFAMNRAAEIHAARGEVEAADQLLDAVLRRDSQNRSARLTRGRLLAGAGDHPAALAALAELEALSPGEAYVTYERAAVHALAGDDAAALAALAASLQGLAGDDRRRALADERFKRLHSHPTFVQIVTPQ
jgi:protein O-GlcNAc transferase